MARPVTPRKRATTTVQGNASAPSIGSQLWGELWTSILKWGTFAGALAVIVATVATTVGYILPAAFRYYSSDIAPWEGKAEHEDDVGKKLIPVTKAIADAAKAAMEASSAAQQSSALAQIAALKEDQRDLCGLADRLAAINMRLRETPMDQFFVDAKTDRLREIDILRKRLQMNGQVPEC